MYGNGQSGYDRMTGVTEPSTEWFFPEARPGVDFSSWLNAQNLSSEPAQIAVDYVADRRVVDSTTLALRSLWREPISLSDAVASTSGYFVGGTSDRSILAQQGLYWVCGDDVHRDLHFGTTLPSEKWLLPTLT
jgi:hypothetical protein